VSPDEADVAALADVLLAGPDIEQEGAGEWGLTIARGYARRVLAAGWRPPLDASPAAAQRPLAAGPPTPPADAAGEAHASGGSGG
jgi:hypothetical protein